jgi:effector-binding domain-containing protein
MTSEPVIVTRVVQPYLAVQGTAAMDQIGAKVPAWSEEVYQWLGQREISTAGPEFIRYNVIDMERQLRLETGLFVAEPSAGDTRVVPGVLPAGRYVSLRRTGHPDQLVTDVTGIMDWADRRGLKWDMKSAADGEHWGARFEVYHTDPATEPDASKWDIELLFRLAD